MDPGYANNGNSWASSGNSWTSTGNSWSSTANSWSSSTNSWGSGNSWSTGTEKGNSGRPVDENSGGFGFNSNNSGRPSDYIDTAPSYIRPVEQDGNAAPPLPAPVLEQPLGKGLLPFKKAPGLTAVITPGQAPIMLPGVSAGGIRTDGVKELCAKLKIDDRFAQLLDAQLQNRPKTFEGDLETLEGILTAAADPQQMLMQKIKEMQSGVFSGMPANFTLIMALATKFTLDTEAVNKMTAALVEMGKVKAKRTLEQLDIHLEASNKPSALVMQLLSKMKKGQDLGTPRYTAGEGSYWENQQKIKERALVQSKEAKKKSRSRSRKGGREKSRDKSRERDFGRDRKRRDKDRDRGRKRKDSSDQSD